MTGGTLPARQTILSCHYSDFRYNVGVKEISEGLENGIYPSHSPDPRQARSEFSDTILDCPAAAAKP